MSDSDTDSPFNTSQLELESSIVTGMSLSRYESASDEDDDDEDECRVCRGSFEDGRPLFSPCRCSGSIGLVHQDCLKEWLSSKPTRGQKCELCGTTFRFAPKYADGAPERLRFHEVVTGFVHRGFDKWLPFLLRLMLCVILWLFILPLCTAYLYYGWLHNLSYVMSRWKYELIAGDAVSGAVITSIIIISFLSLMSFADYLRLHWEQLNDQQRLEAGNEVVAEIARQQNLNVEVRPLERPQPRQLFIVQDDEMDDILEDDFREAMEEHLPDEHQELDGDDFEEDFQPINGHVDGHERHHPIDDEAFDDEDFFPADEARRRREQAEANPQNNLANQEARNPAAPQNRFEPQFEAVQPIIPPGEDLDAMDVQLDLEDIIGVRGPIYALVRNILLLLAFNTTYLGLFVFIPHSLGYHLIKVCSKSSSITNLFELEFPLKSELLYIFSSLNAESRRLNVVILLPDIATIVLGYMFLALGAFLWNTFFTAYMRRTKPLGTQHQPQQHPLQPFHPHPEAFFDDEFEDAEPIQHHRSTAELIQTTFQCAAVVGKVGLLVFLKMLLLPLLLGVCLDATTLTLVGESVSARITYAGGDLFGAILIHWVAGITFMLIVTVSVLQLREVVHPDLFARVIRPQEPHPDLLKNLLKESGTTHAKRMLSSLGIYLTLLLVHVWLPAKLLDYLGLNGWMPLFRTRVWHLCLPQLLVPFELLVFHLCMLSFLEKYKNCIGELQHKWLVRMSGWLELTDYLLPRTIAKFVYVGSRPILMESIKMVNGDANLRCPAEKESSTDVLHREDTIVTKSESYHGNTMVDCFWRELEQMRHPSDDFIKSNLASTLRPGESPLYEVGVIKRDGKRHLKSSEKYLCLPDKEKTKLLTSIGPFRLRRRCSGRSFDNSPMTGSTVIEFWREEPGPPIPRPPEDWDDLREDGPKTGRWAWGDETRSKIEEGIAHRNAFMHSDRKLYIWFKLFLLLVLSWAGTLLALCTSLNLPIILGRVFFSVLSLPEKYHHDPINFAFGVCILFPIICSMDFFLKHGSLIDSFMTWAGRYRRPASKAKIRVLITSLLIWFAAAPLALGLSYRLSISNGSAWWGEAKGVTFREVLDAWVVGTLLLNLWCAVCYLDLTQRNIFFDLGLEINVGDPGQNQNNQRRNEVQREGAESISTTRSWQGSEGRIGCFFRNIYDVLSSWEWEKVDHAVLLDECALPIIQYLLISLVVPTVLENVAAVFHSGRVDGQKVPFLGIVEKGVYRLATFRLLSFLTISIQLAFLFREPLKKWFEKAHQAARDDRYLIGEILLNLPVRA